MADIGTALQLIATALEIAEKLMAIDAYEADEIRETAVHYRSLTLELKAYTNSSRVGYALANALERQMERDSMLLRELIQRGQQRLSGSCD